jgi:hypothetical protein
MVADEAGENVQHMVEVRGWGYLTSVQSLDAVLAAEIQDETGEMIAEALTQYWERMNDK